MGIHYSLLLDKVCQVQDQYTIHIIRGDNSVSQCSFLKFKMMLRPAVAVLAIVAGQTKAAKGEKRPGEKAKSEPAAKKTRNSLLASSFHVFQSKGTGVILRGSYQED